MLGIQVLFLISGAFITLYFSVYFAPSEIWLQPFVPLRFRVLISAAWRKWNLDLFSSAVLVPSYWLIVEENGSC